MRIIIISFLLVALILTILIRTQGSQLSAQAPVRATLDGEGIVMETVTARVTFEFEGGGRPQPEGWEQHVTIKFLAGEQEVLVVEDKSTFDPDNTLAFVDVAGIEPGTYDISVVGPATLTSIRQNVQILGATNQVHLGVLLSGDIDGNGIINISDFGLLSKNFLEFSPIVVVVQPTQAPPPPFIYLGAATIDGQPVPDGFVIVARIGEDESGEAVITNGRYSPLSIAPSSRAGANMTITFHLGNVQAAETDVFMIKFFPTIKRDFDLTFARLPDITPTPTSTPRPPGSTAQPSVYSGLVAATGGGVVPENAEIFARLGTYTSDSVPLVNDEFRNLFVDPVDPSQIGQIIEFFITGDGITGEIKAATTVIFEKGVNRRGVALIFIGLPVPTQTSVAPTATPTPIPTATPTYNKRG